MKNWLSASSTDGGFRDLEGLFFGMLRNGRQIFEEASDALFGIKGVEDVRRDVFDTDATINAAERDIRRRIVIHGTVHGAGSFPSLLVLMSVAKDAERIGDYAKNVFDLARSNPEFGVETERLKELRDSILDLLEKTRGAYRSDDTERAKAQLAEADRIEDACDEMLEENLKVRGRNCASQVLACRYFKRVASHAGNVLTSLVMPLDKLDFFDEP